MNQSTELIVPFDKKNLQLNLLILPLLITLMIILSFFTLPFIRIIFGGLIMMFLIGLIYIHFLIKKDTPAAILNQHGMWVNHYGFITWENISKVKTYSIPTMNNLQVIGIQIKDTSIVRKQASWEGRCGLFWAKIFGYYHISLANIAVKNEDIIHFAKKYIMTHHE